ncbi:MAG: AtpZ/AtpI family protein [Candidatus Aminicenantes bacterium]|nr:AtpZ/AtpI family protein [Candidatus Aminicenantes bacterium]
MSRRSFRSEIARMAELSSTALILPSSIAVGLFFGYFLDRKLATAPWLLLVFTLLGVVSGLLSLFRAVRRQMKDDEAPPPEE